MFSAKKWTISTAILFCGTFASGAALNLKSDSKAIQAKAKSIESEYSRDMKNGNLPANPILESASESQVISTMPNSTASSSFLYPSNLKMRDDRKVGAGVSVGGSLGLIGFNVEFNFEDADGALAGFGTGPGYNSFQLAWKHSFEGNYVTPYTSVGYSRWYNSRGLSSDHTNSDILNRVLTDSEKAEGRFATDFLNVSYGLQYNQLEGDFAGVTFFGELTGMYEAKRAILLPNGSVGALYYF